MAEPRFFENFELALKKLVQFSGIFDGSEIQRAGVIQAFEFTFEQCWKAIQKKAGSEGVAIASPKKAFEWAIAAGWIPAREEDAWIQMLNDRNLSAHTYRESMAIQVSDRVISAHQAKLLALLGEMQER